MSGYEEKTIQRMETAEFAEREAEEFLQKEDYPILQQYAFIVAAREKALKSFAYKIATAPQFNPEELTNAELALLLKDLNKGQLSANIDRKKFNNLLETLIDTTFFQRVNAVTEKQSMYVSELNDFYTLLEAGREIYKKRKASDDEKKNHSNKLNELYSLSTFYSHILARTSPLADTVSIKRSTSSLKTTSSPTPENADVLPKTETEEEFVFDVIEKQENTNSEQNSDAFFAILTPEQLALYEKIADVDDLKNLSSEERMKALEFFATYPQETEINYDDAAAIYDYTSKDYIAYFNLCSENVDFTNDNNPYESIHQNIAKNITAEMAEEILRKLQATKKILEYIHNTTTDETQKTDCENKIDKFETFISSIQNDIKFINSDEYQITKDELEKQIAEPQPTTVSDEVEASPQNDEANSIEALKNILTAEYIELMEKTSEAGGIENLSPQDRVKALELIAAHPKEFEVNYKDAMELIGIVDNDNRNYNDICRNGVNFLMPDFLQAIHKNIVKDVSLEQAELIVQELQAAKKILEYTNGICEDEEQKQKCQKEIESFDVSISSAQLNLAFINSDEYKEMKEELEKEKTSEPTPKPTPTDEEDRTPVLQKYKEVVRPIVQELAKHNDIELKEQPLDESKPQRLAFDTFYSEKAKQENKADGNISFENRNRAVTTDDFQTVLLAVKTAKKMGAKNIKIGKTNKEHSANMIIAASIAGTQIRGGLPIEELKDNPKIAIIIERRELRKQIHKLREDIKKESDATKQAELQQQLDAKIQIGLQMAVEKGTIDARKDGQTLEQRLERVKNIATKKHSSAGAGSESGFREAQARLQAFVASQQSRS